MAGLKIGIIGYGMVGGAVGAWLPKAAKFDLIKFPDGLSLVKEADIVFICVPTPYDAKRGYDLRNVMKAAKSLTGKKIVVLKSTVLPGTTAALQKKFPRHTWLFNPEFLNDKTAVNDFLHPDRQIIGMAKNTPRHRAAAKRIMQLLPTAPFRRIVTATEAETVKLCANSYLATKVILANMMYDVCQISGADYEKVKDGVGHDPRIGMYILRIWQDGFRGFSGKCLPKDTGALIVYGRKHHHPITLLETVDAINRKLVPKKHFRR